MTKFLPKNFLHLRKDVTATVASPTQTLFFFLQIHPFSSSSATSSSSPSSFIDKSLNQSSFTVNYLTNSCGLTPGRARFVSRYVSFKVADNPDSVLGFFKNQGFTQTQISGIISAFPALLRYNPQKILLPKIEFLKSKGIPAQDIVVIISRTPRILGMSLENRLIPSFNFVSNFLQCNEKTISALKRFGAVLCFDHEKYLKSNIELLKALGLPLINIEHLLIKQPRTLLTSCDRFTKVVDEVKKMGFPPSRNIFLLAVRVLRSMTKTTWDRKIKVYKKWGWSENDVVDAFRKGPSCMTLSEDKITLVMEFWVKKMGWESSFLANRPYLMGLSLEKRIVPRCKVYQVLVSKGFLNPSDAGLGTLLAYNENLFWERFINPYKVEAPELLDLYKEKLDVAKQFRHGRDLAPLLV